MWVKGLSMKKRHAVRLTLGGGLSLLLAACSQSPAPGAPDPYAGGASFPWSYTAPTDRLSVLTLTPGVNTLYYEPLLAASNSWGPIEINHSNGERGAGDGRPITLNGVVYKRGFGTHASSEMRYSLKGSGATCTTFTADIGVDDEVGSRGSVVFQVYLDGVKKYDSGTMTGTSATKKASVALSGAQELRMVVTDAGDGIDYDHADWANPKIICVATTPTPQPSGTLDPGFGTNGIADTGGVDAVLEPDNAVLIASTVDGNFALRRLMPNGSVQQVVTDFGGQDVAYAVTRQPDGKIVVAGRSDNRFALARYNTNLSLDASFGTGGKATTLFRAAGPSVARAVTLQDDGKIVAAGTVARPVTDFSVFNDVAVARYGTNGQLDPTFGTGGTVAHNFDSQADSGFSDDEARAVIVQPGGKIVVAGKSDPTGGERHSLLTRLNTDGTLDTSFGSAGSLVSGSYAIYSDVAQEANGNLVVVGYTGRYYDEGSVQRYSPNGSPLGGATVTFSPGNAFDKNILARVLVQPDGKLLISGVTQTVSVAPGAEPGPYETVLARLNPSLSLDPSFGTGGRVVVPIVTEPGSESPDITPLRQSDGKIVVVGSQTARLLP